ncbi:Phosphoribosylformylglycinamidine synthase subunit PurL [Dissostichus eleginoides]|uniref:Phosphoribosylformylglycinamidine synthase subunit PurL n=1 Tax=Dissostichus eleginoides TaxID=100907 RepID=A0AAD9F8F8_DISEL|nr:Phosphoribosylformylglycinamidine synthase subunit PurL [Dissostichus eleginoides]
MQTNFGLVQLRNPSPLRSKDLTPAEFALAFSLYRDVICSVYPTRRTELDEYLLIELDMALRFGGSGFYTYHVHFASQAAGRIKQFNQDQPTPPFQRASTDAEGQSSTREAGWCITISMTLAALFLAAASCTSALSAAALMPGAPALTTQLHQQID